MEPRDLDILVPSMDHLRKLYDFVNPSMGMEASPEIVSETFPGGFEWHKVQWNVEGFTTEAVYIASGGGIPDGTEGEGIWEGGQHIWSLIRYAPFRGYSIPVVPLEVQLESQLRRGREDRATTIIKTLQARGVDESILQKSLSHANRAKWAAKLDEPIR
jgi:hypothetical protein